MLAKRIIACLDVDCGRVVKGTNFVDIRDAGDPVELAKKYSDEGADEIVLLDITATVEDRDTIADIVAKIARKVFVPLTVGGGIRSVEDARRLLNSGADKVSVNSAAIARGELLSELSAIYGSQATVLAIDVRRYGEGWHVFSNGGRVESGLDAVEWAQKGQEMGAGEVLLTSMDADGTKSGFDLELISAVCGGTRIPVVASGGAGRKEDFVELFRKTDADAGLAASIFHFRETSIRDTKEALADAGITVRPS